MKCPECHTENPENRRFCREGSDRLLLLCPECKAENLPGEKFCAECGYTLQTPKETASIDYSQPQPHIPKCPSDMILTSRTFATFKNAGPPKLSSLYPFIVRRKS